MNKLFEKKYTYRYREACHLTTNPSNEFLQMNDLPLHNHMLIQVHPVILCIGIFNYLCIILSHENGHGYNHYLLNPCKNLDHHQIKFHRLFMLFSSLLTTENNNHEHILNTNLDPHIHIPYTFAYILSSHRFLLFFQGSRCKDKDTCS